jgi:epsilon-lactone hydrolase
MSDVMFSLPVLRWFASMYLTEPDLHLHPTVSPLTGDFTGLPPLLFQAGTGEMLLDDSTRSAAKAHAAGVPVRLQVFEGMPHVFQYLSLFPETQLADRHLAEFLATYAGWGPVVKSA